MLGSSGGGEVGGFTVVVAVIVDTVVVAAEVSGEVPASEDEVVALIIRVVTGNDISCQSGQTI